MYIVRVTSMLLVVMVFIQYFKYIVGKTCDRFHTLSTSASKKSNISDKQASKSANNIRAKLELEQQQSLDVTKKEDLLSHEVVNVQLGNLYNPIKWLMYS